MNWKSSAQGGNNRSTAQPFRPRHSNDNALVESKNASAVRKWLGYAKPPYSRDVGIPAEFNW